MRSYHYFYNVEASIVIRCLARFLFSGNSAPCLHTPWQILLYPSLANLPARNSTARTTTETPVMSSVSSLTPALTSPVTSSVTSVQTHNSSATTGNVFRLSSQFYCIQHVNVVLGSGKKSMSMWRWPPACSPSYSQSDTSCKHAKLTHNHFQQQEHRLSSKNNSKPDLNCNHRIQHHNENYCRRLELLKAKAF